MTKKSSKLNVTNVNKSVDGSSLNDAGSTEYQYFSSIQQKQYDFAELVGMSYLGNSKKGGNAKLVKGSTNLDTKSIEKVENLPVPRGHQIVKKSSDMLQGSPEPPVISASPSLNKISVSVSKI